MLIIAHAGHILIDAPLFMGPVLIMAGALFVSARRNRDKDHGSAE